MSTPDLAELAQSILSAKSRSEYDQLVEHFASLARRESKTRFPGQKTETPAYVQMMERKRNSRRFGPELSLFLKGVKTLREVAHKSGWPFIEPDRQDSYLEDHVVLVLMKGAKPLGRFFLLESGKLVATGWGESCPPGSSPARGVGRYAGVDWSRSDPEIAKELGVHKTAVSHQRMKLAPETGRKCVHWSTANVDWTQKNRVLARQLGCSLGAVEQARTKFAPKN